MAGEAIGRPVPGGEISMTTVTGSRSPSRALAIWRVHRMELLPGSVAWQESVAAFRSVVQGLSSTTSRC